MDYETIQNGVPSDISVDLEIGGGTCEGAPVVWTYSAAVPQSTTANYVPSSSSSSKHDSDKSNSSFKQIRESGQIKMTDYSVSSTQRENFLMKNQMHSASLGWPHCLDWSYAEEQIKSIASWNLVEDLDAVKLRRSTMPFYNSEIDIDLDSEINSVKADVVSDSYQALDALTTFAEVGDSLELIKNTIQLVTNPLRSFSKLVKSLKKNNKKFSIQKINERISDAWLQYRYAIMPDILTVCDSMALLQDRKYIFKTSRSLRGTNLKPIDLPSSAPNYYLYSTHQGTITVRATGKARFSSANLRLFDQISFNPALTAWELVPYSFVVDWFINVGDVISSRSLALADFAQQRLFCYSVKQEITTNTYYHNDYENEFTREYDSEHIVEWKSGPLGGEHLLRTDTLTKYDRRLFHPSSVKLAFDPSMNWMRYLDAYSLSLKPLTRALRKL